MTHDNVASQGLSLSGIEGDLSERPEFDTDFGNFDQSQPWAIGSASGSFMIEDDVMSNYTQPERIEKPQDLIQEVKQLALNTTGSSLKNKKQRKEVKT